MPFAEQLKKKSETSAYRGWKITSLHTCLLSFKAEPTSHVVIYQTVRIWWMDGWMNYGLEQWCFWVSLMMAIKKKAPYHRPLWISLLWVKSTPLNHSPTSARVQYLRSQGQMRRCAASLSVCIFRRTLHCIFLTNARWLAFTRRGQFSCEADEIFIGRIVVKMMRLKRTWQYSGTPGRGHRWRTWRAGHCGGLVWTRRKKHFKLRFPSKVAVRRSSVISDRSGWYVRAYMCLCVWQGVIVIYSSGTT